MKSYISNDEDGPLDAHSLRAALLTLAQQSLDAKPGDRTDCVGLLESLLGGPICRRVGIYRLPDDFLLSVVMPVFNEAATIEKVVDRVRRAAPPCEIVIVDDGSTDGTRDVLQSIGRTDNVRVVLHEKNQGKGAALKTGFAHVRGDVVVIQDADMEYDPRDYWMLLEPIVQDRADVVYGSRFTSGDRRVSPRWHQSVNRLITRLSNVSTGLKFSDVETCYKMFRRELVDRFAPTLRESGFGIELEMTAKLARMKDVRFGERPISYARRSYSEGKKIGWRDGVWALWCIVRY